MAVQGGGGTRRSVHLLWGRQANHKSEMPEVTILIGRSRIVLIVECLPCLERGTASKPLEVWGAGKQWRGVGMSRIASVI